MAVGVCPWYDFIVYTSKGVSVECVRYDQEFWEKDLLPKLEEFCNKCIAPEIVCPVCVFGSSKWNVCRPRNTLVTKFCKYIKHIDSI